MSRMNWCMVHEFKGRHIESEGCAPFRLLLGRLALFPLSFVFRPFLLLCLQQSIRRALPIHPQHP